MVLRKEVTKLWIIRRWHGLVSTSSKFAASVYANPSVVIPITATFSGILLSAGMSLFLRIISTDNVQKPGIIQYVGLALMIGAILYAWITWSAQQFLDYLRYSLDKDGKPKDRFPIKEKRDDFILWKGKRNANWALCLGIIFIVVFVIFILILATSSEQKVTVWLIASSR